MRSPQKYKKINLFRLGCHGHILLEDELLIGDEKQRICWFFVLSEGAYGGPRESFLWARFGPTPLACFREDQEGVPLKNRQPLGIGSAQYVGRGLVTGHRLSFLHHFKIFSLKIVTRLQKKENIKFRRMKKILFHTKNKQIRLQRRKMCSEKKILQDHPNVLIRAQRNNTHPHFLRGERRKTLNYIFLHF